MMTSRHALFLTGVLATQAAFSAVLTAAERPAAAAATIPNAAVIYWQAFAQLPAPLAEPQKAKYEAAVANPSAPVVDDLKPIIASFAGSLAELHRAARVAACDWNLDYEAGAGCLLPHLEKARALSKAALLRSRLGFAAGKTDEAVADVVAVLKLACDCGSSPVVTTPSMMELTSDVDSSVRGCPCPERRRCWQVEAGCRKRSQHRVNEGLEGRSERPTSGAWATPNRRSVLSTIGCSR